MDNLPRTARHIRGFNGGVPKQRQRGLLDGARQRRERSFKVNPKPPANRRTWSGIGDRDLLLPPAGCQAVPQDGRQFLVHDARGECLDGRPLAVELRPAREKCQDELALHIVPLVDAQPAASNKSIRLPPGEILDDRECLIKGEINHGGPLPVRFPWRTAIRAGPRVRGSRQRRLRARRRKTRRPAAEVGVGFGRLPGVRRGRELDVTHRRRPGIQHQLAAADLQILEAAKAKLLHGGDESRFGRQHVLGCGGRGHRAASADAATRLAAQEPLLHV